MAITQPRTDRFPGAAADSVRNADSARRREKAAGAAAAEARKNSWNMAIAIVDTGGHLVYFEKMDNTQTGSVNVAIDKARSAALFRRPTKVFQDGVAAGGEDSASFGSRARSPSMAVFRLSSGEGFLAASASPAAAASRTGRSPGLERIPSTNTVKQ